MTVDAISPHRKGTNVSPYKVRGSLFMFRKCLAASVAAAPLLLLAGQAMADTTISDKRTSPVDTGTINGGAPDNIIVALGAGVVIPSTGAAGPIITVSTNNTLNNKGEISSKDVNGSIGVQINGGVTTTFTNSGLISITDSYDQSAAANDTNHDGNLDGPFAMGTGRYGLLITGPGTVTGNILNDVGGTIAVEGNNSYGISVESALNGNLTNSGAITVVGDNVFGVRTTGAVTGNITIGGSVSATGLNAVGVAIDNDVTGALQFQGAIAATGYRYPTRPINATDRAALGADDLLQGGPGIRVAGSVTGGIRLTADPASSVTVAGAAPALLVGSDTQNINIGAVGAGDLNYGLIISGGVSANGVYDNISATGVQIGGSGGFTTLLTNGLLTNGNIAVTSYNAQAQALHLASGANVATINNTGAIFVGMTTTSAPLASEGVFDIFAIRIDAGATNTSLINSGSITASILGESSTAYAVSDGAGLLTSVVNTGQIVALVTATDDSADTDDADNDPSNEVVAGKAVALDLSHNTTGVTILQYTPAAVGTADPVLPGIDGDIRLGSGDDTINLQGGTIFGDISFGNGADVFTVGTATSAGDFTGSISDTDGQLAINVVNGTLQLNNAGIVDATSLTMSANSTLIVRADALTATEITVATANIATGAKIGLNLTSLIGSTDQTYTIIKTDTPGGLTAGAIDGTLLGSAPYIAVASIVTDTAAGEVNLVLHRRTAAEMSLTVNEGLALNEFYSAVTSDTGVLNAFLGAKSREEFLALYDQILPNQGEGMFSSLDAITSTISRLTATRPDPRERYGPDSFWMQEINIGVMRDAGASIGSSTQAFGFVGGYESMGADGGALGATLAFVTAEEKDDIAKIGEHTSVSLLEAGVYWRRAVNNWLFSARGSAGYAWFDSDRMFLSPTDSLIREATAGWSGFTGQASVSAAYEANLGVFYLRPLVSIDYLYLNEGSRQETGGQDAFNLFIDGRNSSRLSGTAEVAFGATFGRELWWRPELRLGYRARLGGEVGQTRFRFKNGQLVALAPDSTSGGAAIIGLSLKAGTPMSYVAIEGEYQATDSEDIYNLQLAGRMMF